MFEQKATKEVTLIPTGIGYRPFVDSKAAYNYSNNRTYL